MEIRQRPMGIIGHRCVARQSVAVWIIVEVMSSCISFANLKRCYTCTSSDIVTEYRICTDHPVSVKVHCICILCYAVDLWIVRTSSANRMNWKVKDNSQSEYFNEPVSLDLLSSFIVAIFEHVLVGGIQCPKISFSFTGICHFTGDFKKTFVETQIVSNAVLPSFVFLFVIWKLFVDVFVYSRQGKAFLCWALDRHCN